jgi:hypothetical protein
MAYNRYSAFYAAYNTSVAKGNPNSKVEVVNQFTNGKTSSLQDLSDWELQELVRRLNTLTGAKYAPKTDEEIKKDKLRKAIISQFHLMNRTPAQAKAWAEKYGVQGAKLPFNGYNASQLYLLLKNAEQVVADWRKSIRKAVINN